ncbi:hypothetical protein XELAEV_18018768mg [Xenopus laevis]|uniref:Uncharacterized protein n=1 Tax=Xenopus laevis TaxID=8355 RepID=A0A974HTS1_XENLA|nr:hypothetical protein XELAEV_18018768mg [Xenopus laevis]
MLPRVELFVSDEICHNDTCGQKLKVGMYRHSLRWPGPPGLQCEIPGGPFLWRRTLAQPRYKQGSAAWGLHKFAMWDMARSCGIAMV